MVKERNTINTAVLANMDKDLMLSWGQRTLGRLRISPKSLAFCVLVCLSSCASLCKPFCTVHAGGKSKGDKLNLFCWEILPFF